MKSKEKKEEKKIQSPLVAQNNVLIQEYTQHISNQNIITMIFFGLPY